MAKQRASVCEPPSLLHKKKSERVGPGEMGKANSPPPASLPACDSNKLTETLRIHSLQLILLHSSLQRPGGAPFQTRKPVCETLMSCYALTGGQSTQNCVCGSVGVIPWLSGVAKNVSLWLSAVPHHSLSMWVYQEASLSSKAFSSTTKTQLLSGKSLFFLFLGCLFYFLTGKSTVLLKRFYTGGHLRSNSS